MRKSLIAIVVLFCTGAACTTKEESTSNTVDPAPTQWINYKAADPNGEHIVLISGDEEYRSEEALPQLAAILSTYHGFECTVLFSQDPDKLGIADPNHVFNIPGLEVLNSADLMVIFTRFRSLPDEQMGQIKEYLMKGKPVIGIRTATHAFQIKDSTSSYIHWSNSYKNEESPWDGGFGRLVLGEKWYTHHGHHKQQSTRGLFAPGATDHPILNGIEEGSIWGPTDVYGVRLPLPGDSKPLVLGQVIDREGEYDETDPLFGMKSTDSEIATKVGEKAYNPNDPMMPIAWTKSYSLPEGQEGISFTSTIGSSTDMLTPEVRRLFVNASYFLLNLEVPLEANVDVVGTYEPSAYSFQSDEFWEEKNIVITEIKKEVP